MTSNTLVRGSEGALSALGSQDIPLNSQSPIIPDIAAIMAKDAYAYKPPGLVAYSEGLKNQEVRYDRSAGQKLVIPSIKRDLVFRQGRNVYARPFLHNFMEYMLRLQSRDLSMNPAPPFAVFLWSTAMPETLQPMLDTYLKPWLPRILGKWDRVALGLRDDASYRGNPDTFKDLQKLFDHLINERKAAVTSGRLPVDLIPSVANSVLIEESVKKCRLQPLNFLPITDYDQSEHHRTVAAIRHHAQGQSWRKPRTSVNTGADLLHLVFGGTAQEFYAKCVCPVSQNNLSGDSAIMQVDGMLLAVIGILSELQHVANVPVWIAAGGLQPDVAHTFTGSIAQGGWKEVLELDDGSIRSPPSPSIIDQQDSKALPSWSRGEEWYKSPILVFYWVRRGLKALKERGIAPQHGVDAVSKNSW